MRAPSGLQSGLPMMVLPPWRTSSRAGPPARGITKSDSGPPWLDRKARKRPSADSSTCHSVAALLRTRRAGPPRAGISQICQFPPRSEANSTPRPSCVNRGSMSCAGSSVSRRGSPPSAAMA